MEIEGEKAFIYYRVNKNLRDIMIVFKISIAFIFSFFVLISCTSPFSNNPEQISGQEFEFGEEFELNFGESAFHEKMGIEIRFTELEEEGRCPKDVSCVWAGNATIKILFSVKDDSRTLNLETYPNPDKRRVNEDFIIQLNELSPYPETAEASIPAKEYTATILVDFVEE